MSKKTRPKVCTSDILKLYREGLSQRAIAAQLGISRATVVRKLATSQRAA